MNKQEFIQTHTITLILLRLVKDIITQTIQVMESEIVEPDTK